MNVNGNYDTVDVWSTISPDVVGSRSVNPYGTCVHHTDGADSLAWLTGDSARAGQPASADCLINKLGKRYHLTNDHLYSYGVGQVASTIIKRGGSYNPNQLFMNVELEYFAVDGPSYAQYDSLAEQITLYAIRWSWRFPYVIFGHYGIAAPLGRKSDPYLFDWGELMGRLVYWTRRNHVAGLDI